MEYPRQLRALGIDVFTILLVATVALAVLLPASGDSARWVGLAAYWAVALLFFVYGAKLSPAAVLAGIRNWRLQLAVLLMTFVAMPLLGLGVGAVLGNSVSPILVTGIVFLTILPSTVQSSIAFTSMASGNVGAAICAASISNLLGVLATPVLAGLVLRTGELTISGRAIVGISLQIVLPFILGQVARPLIGGFIATNRALTQVVDRGSILLIVYSAFSAGVVAGVWQRVGPLELAMLFALAAVLLAAGVVIANLGSRVLGFDRADRMVMLFCGATKSLASGVPIASIIFPASSLSIVVLPIMFYHQLQLIFFASVAEREAHSLESAKRTPALRDGSAARIK